MSSFDVLVVGGGPAGSAVATFCAQQGLAVALIEHKHFPRHKVCGDVINPSCWPVLGRLGVTDALQGASLQPIDGVVIAPSRGPELHLPAHLTAMRRSAFDACLLRQARAAGVQVWEGEAVRAAQPGWTVSTASRTWSARILIGADGRQSAMARITGLGAAGRVNRHWRRVVALQAHYPAPASLDRRVYLHLFPGGYSGLVRVDEGQANLCIVTETTLAGQRDPEALFARTVWQNPHFRALGIAPEPSEPLQGAYPLRRPDNLPTRANVFLVGDALRVVEPFSGQGIFFALRTAELAAAAIRDSKLDYAAASRALYRQRARTNHLIRRLFYRDRAASRLIGLLNACPAILNWLAANVLHE